MTNGRNVGVFVIQSGPFVGKTHIERAELIQDRITRKIDEDMQGIDVKSVSVSFEDGAAYVTLLY